MQGTQVVTSDDTGETVFRWKEGVWSRAIRWAPDRSGLFYESGVLNAPAAFVAIADLACATFIPAEALEALEALARIPQLVEDNEDRERRSTTFFAVPQLAAGTGVDLQLTDPVAMQPYEPGSFGWQLMRRYHELDNALCAPGLSDDARRELRYGAMVMYELARCYALSGGR